MRWWSLAHERGANELSQCCVLMKEPSECNTDSAYLGSEGCSVRRECFEPCLSFKLDVREYTLELSDSRPDLFLYFGVIRFRQFSMLQGQVFFNFDFIIIDV